MKLKDIMSWSDGFTDEVQTSTLALGYANKAISTINTSFNLTLPFITDIEAEYTAISENWFVRFMMDALSYGIKMNDGSMTEAREYKTSFDTSMYEFEGVDKTSVIGEEYLPAQGSTIYQMDTSNALDLGWFGPVTDEWNGW